MAANHHCDRCGTKTPKAELVSVDVIEKPDWDRDNVVGGTVDRDWLFCEGCYRGLIEWLKAGKKR